MKQNNMLAMILAGGRGTRLHELTKKVAKPAVSYGGKYRIIDFPLSNCINSGIDTVGVLTQYQPLRLNTHIGIGMPWDLDRNNGGVTILSPYERSAGSDWYSGTANAIYQNIDYIDTYNPDYVLILSGDHIYKMDYEVMLEYHKENQAAVTIACMPVPWEEASRFGVVITDENGVKQGLGNMEMMPDIAICDPEVTASMPPHITAETGMDALTHALEALASNRANYVSNILAKSAAKDIIETLPKAYEDGQDMKAREIMVNASMVAGMAFTNVSLGIVHSMAHTVGSYFHVAHGLADAILLPYVMEFNSAEPYAKKVYEDFAEYIGEKDLIQTVKELNQKVGIPTALKDVIPEEEKYMDMLDEMAKVAKADGCTKTNPIIPEPEQFKELFVKAYRG